MFTVRYEIVYFLNDSTTFWLSPNDICLVDKVYHTSIMFLTTLIRFKLGQTRYSCALWGISTVIFAQIAQTLSQTLSQTPINVRQGNLSVRLDSTLYALLL